jgi:hypothetical protein
MLRLVLQTAGTEGVGAWLENGDLFSKPVAYAAAEHIFDLFVDLRHQLDGVKCPVDCGLKTLALSVDRVEVVLQRD